MKKWMISLLAMLTIFMLAGCRTSQTKTKKSVDKTTTSTQQKKVTPLKSSTPTVFIHGYGGTVNSFGGMIQRLEKAGETKKELVITVEADGTLQVEGQLNQEKVNPSVQVLFAANQDNEWNQTEWIYTVLKYLKQAGADQVNLVGHSMGGVSSLRYLTTYGQPTDASNVQRLIAIGAPFNDFTDTATEQTVDELLQNGPSQQSSRYTDYRSGVTNIPVTTTFLLIAGKADDQATSDGTVPLTSALAPYALLKAHGNQVTEQIFTGQQAQHSQLHENSAVDKAVIKFLWR
ncbi:alpha/beta fold hydrolase [Enterococcus hermanniensis]|nr:alpha/beta fold hydrolase [Enterococcus hermanniensis]